MNRREVVDFSVLAAHLERERVPGCTTTVFRHDVRAELSAPLVRILAGAVAVVAGSAGALVMLVIL